MTDLLRCLPKCFVCCLIHIIFCLIEIAFDMSYSSCSYWGGDKVQKMRIVHDVRSVNLDASFLVLCRS